LGKGTAFIRHESSIGVNTPTVNVSNQMETLKRNSRKKKRTQRDTLQRRKAYVGGIGNQLSQENLLVAVKCIDNETEQLIDLCLEGKCLNLAHLLSSIDNRHIRRVPLQSSKSYVLLQILNMSVFKKTS